MPLIALGINHTTAPIEVRERFAFDPAVLPDALQRLAALPAIRGGVIVSTCNRTEVYTEATGTEALTALADWLLAERAPDQPELRDRLYTHTDSDAVRHLLRVASGLDSLVLGEPQILGQVKQAYQLAAERGRVGTQLHRAFQHAFAVAKQVRTDTDIGSSPVSVAFAAVRLAQQIFGNLKPHTALLVGAGETIELTARHLHEQGLRRMVVANRTLERAQALASQFDAYTIGLDALPAHLGEADIVISSTASPSLIITEKMMTRALHDRRRKPMFMVDLAVPRDIDAGLAEQDDIYLYSVDDLQSVIQANLRSRQAAAEEALDIIEREVADFSARLRSADIGPSIKALRQSAGQLRDDTLEQARRMLANGRSDGEALEYLAKTLTNRLLHAPTQGLRDAAAAGDEQLVEAIHRLYDLDGDAE